jgi:hypothetical protein
VVRNGSVPELCFFFIDSSFQELHNIHTTDSAMPLRRVGGFATLGPVIIRRGEGCPEEPGVVPVMGSETVQVRSQLLHPPNHGPPLLNEGEEVAPVPGRLIGNAAEKFVFVCRKSFLNCGESRVLGVCGSGCCRGSCWLARRGRTRRGFPEAIEAVQAGVTGCRIVGHKVLAYKASEPGHHRSSM